MNREMKRKQPGRGTQRPLKEKSSANSRQKSELSGADFERDELHRALKSALETQVLVCAVEWISFFFFSDYVGSGMRPTIEYAEGGAARQDSVTNDLRQTNEPLGAHARVALTGPTVAEYFRDAEEAETKAAATTAVASNAKSRAAFESQSSDRIAESDVAEETMSVMVKLAKDPLEPNDIAQPSS